MRNVLIIIFLGITMSLSGATYYVATNGSDSNPGTISQPWLTIQKGFSSISPGDILYIRGGTYYPTGTVSGGAISGAVANGKKGTASSMYNVFAYPGEFPVMDCSNITSTSYNRFGIFIVSSDYWYIKGIEITRCDQPSGHIGQGVMIMSGNYNKFEAIVSHHNGGPGMGIRDQSEGNLFLNCDSYSNYDPLTSTPGDDADGFDIGFITARSGNDRINTLQGCRSWLNADDGYDMYQYPGYHGIYVLKDCWSWKNGYMPDGVSQAGDGNGFKYGADNNYSLDGVVRRSSYNCIAYANRQRGFSQEAANVREIFYNCTAYQNGSWGFSFYDYDTPDILRNNLSYKNPDGTIQNQGTKRTHDHNSWDSNVTLSDADFLSLDGSQLAAARKADGSLPDITFLHLATGSDLIDAGVNVGLPFTGNAPDIGAFEGQGPVSATNPVFISASVESSAASTVVMNYDQVLNSLAVPAASSFTVMVNLVGRNVSTVTISGTTVMLNLSAPVVSGDVILVAYAKPASNPIQNTGGLEADNLTSRNVTNKLASIVPEYVSSVVENSTSSVLEITYSSTLANVVPATSSFTVLVNSTRRSVNTVSINGSKVQLRLASPVVFGDVVTVSYTKPSSNVLQTASGGQAASLSSRNVINNVLSTSQAGNIPPYVSISNPSKGNNFDNPSDIEIKVIASDKDGSVNKVELYAGDWKIAELTAEPYVYVWKGVTTGTYQIKAVATDNLNATSTSTTVEFTVGDKPVYDGNSEIINLYPNPNSGHFSIEFLTPIQSARTEIVISDMSGNQIQREPVTPEETVKQVDIRSARTGFYILTVVSDQILVTKKIIVK